MFLFYLSVFIFSPVSPGRTGHHNINHVHLHHHHQDEFYTDGPTRIWKIWTEELSSRENCLKTAGGGRGDGRCVLFCGNIKHSPRTWARSKSDILMNFQINNACFFDWDCAFRSFFPFFSFQDNNKELAAVLSLEFLNSSQFLFGWWKTDPPQPLSEVEKWTFNLKFWRVKNPCFLYKTLPSDNLLKISQENLLVRIQPR